MLHVDNDLHIFRNDGFVQYFGIYNYIITTFVVVMDMDLHIFLRLYYPQYNIYL